MKCDVLKKEFPDFCVRECLHPNVVSKYGSGKNYANISVYICRKCKFSRKHDLINGYTCVYGKEDTP